MNDNTIDPTDATDFDIRSLNDRLVSTVFGADDIDRLGEFVADDVSTTVDGRRMDGLDDYTTSLLELTGAFSDLSVEILDSYVDGDTLVTRTRYDGVHTGEFDGIAATDATVSWESMSVSRAADGKFVEIETIQDRAGLLGQLGVLDESAA